MLCHTFRQSCVFGRYKIELPGGPPLPETYLIIKRRLKISESIPSILLQIQSGLQKKLPENLKNCIKSLIHCKFTTALSQTVAQSQFFTKKEENSRKKSRSSSSCIVIQRYVALTDIPNRIGKTWERRSVFDA